jgi:hypothetical protein
MVDCVISRCAAQGEAQLFVFDEMGYGGVEGFSVFGRNDEAAALDDEGDLRVRVGGGDYGTSAGEHSGETRGHNQIGGVGALGKKVDVGGVEEIVEAIEGLERKQGYVGAVSDESFKLRAEGAIAAEEEVHSRVLMCASKGECFGQWGEEFEPLLRAHVARVQEDDLVFDAGYVFGEFAA